MGPIIMKFGGTSVATAERIEAVAAIVASHLDRRPIVVVSAVGVSAPGEAKITDQLEAMAELAHAHKPYQENLDKVRVKHEKVLKELGLSWQLISPVWTKLKSALSDLDRPYEEFLDDVFSFGERLSSHIVADVLNARGTPAICVDVDELDIVTDENFQDATVAPENEGKILGRFRTEQRVLVVPGFAGHTSDGRVTTLGRGGSDYTAALVGVALGAGEIQIWSDVSGMRSADPCLIPDAERLDVISFNEAKELAAFGARVLHPKTIEPAMRKDIPVVILNSFRPQDKGTAIRAGHIKQNKMIKAIAHKSGVKMLSIESTNMLGASGYMARIFTIFAKYRIDIEMMATSEVSISMTINDNKNLDKAVEELKEFANVTLERGRTVICVVGEGMRHTPGVSGRVFGTLGIAGVNVEMITQGGSEINITFLVDDKDADRAIKALYYACIG